MNRRKFLLRTIIILVCCLALVLYGRNASAARIRGSLRGVGIGIYSDSRCTTTLNFIDWGQVEPGTTRNLTCYVRNEGGTVGSLSLSETYWNPSGAYRSVFLRWNYAGQLLSPQQVIAIVLTLALSANVTTEFSFTFDCVITLTS
jgi:hypothetical protein